MSYTVKNAIGGDYPDYLLDYSKVLVSRGTLTPADNAAVAASAGKLTFSWDDNSGTGEALATDLAMPLVFNKDKGIAVFSTSAATRTESTIGVNVPADWTGDKVELYLSFASADGKTVAESIYIGEETVI